MNEMTLPLARTVFLPKGSPGICTVRQIKADITRFELDATDGRLFCSGEIDLLIEYLSFAEGEQYPGYEGYEQQIPGGGSMWQALLTLPFELTENIATPCPPTSELKMGRLKWYMVAPHALEMEMELCLSWQEEQNTPMPLQQENDWQQVGLSEIRRTGEGKRLETENLGLEKEEKIMRISATEQGWQLATGPEEEPAVAAEEVIEAKPAPEGVLVVEETLIFEETCMVEDEPTFAEELIAEAVAVAEEETLIVAEEALVIEEEIIITEVTIEEEYMMMEEEPCAPQEAPMVITAPTAPPVIIQTVETPYQPQPPAQPEMGEGLLAGMVAEAKEEEQQPAGRRMAGMPRLMMRRQQIRQSYQANQRLENKE